MKLSVVVPARNEEGAIARTVGDFDIALREAGIAFEIVVVDDGSADATPRIVQSLAAANGQIRLIRNEGRHGFGLAIRCGLSMADGDAIAIVMADASDSPADLVLCYRMLEQGYDCVFGSRFIRGGKVRDYPRHKLILNRMANWFIRALFNVPFNDFTNAFKLYRRHVIEGLQPLISPHFNLTVEMPLKAIVRGYSFGVVPITWTNRKTGVSKLKIKEMGSRYLFIVLYLWLEKALAQGDYHRSQVGETSADQAHAAEPHHV